MSGQNVSSEPDIAVIKAAQTGDRGAQDRLVDACLPLVYNIVGRSLRGHADTDDVVQDVMLRMLRGLAGLRSPERFRSWLVAITMNHIREHWRERTSGAIPVGDGLDGAAGDSRAADPGVDFVDLTIARLGLSGQRREVAEATRWLDADDQELLSLWWLEAAGRISRSEVATALELSPRHTAVRVQRMKERLETSRVVVRCLAAEPRCVLLDHVLEEWDGSPSGLWRKRVARHARDCTVCMGKKSGLIPAEGLLVGLALVPLAARGAAPQPEPAPAPAGSGTPVSPRAHARQVRARRRRTTAGAAAAVAVVLGGGAYLATGPGEDDDAPLSAREAPAPSLPTSPPRTSPPAPTPSPTPSPSDSPTPQPPATPTESEPSPPPPSPEPPAPEPEPAPGQAPVSDAERVVELVNEERADAGCGPVQSDEQLRAAAQGHSEDMADRDYFDHTSPDGSSPGDRITAAGYDWSTYGENIAAGQRTPESVMDAWMNSPGHRANILNCAFEDLGVGLHDGPGGPWWTQAFGARF